MSIQLTIDLPNSSGVQSLLSAVEMYKANLRTSIKRTQQRLYEFERKYQVTTAYFLTEMAAEDLDEDDMRYVEWAGEAKLLEGLQAELEALELDEILG
ncbi:MAG: hypothetical protein NT075_11445 [Chloroflexi bacterium]|nr:hypothetical protein [Chloroflexota bacterium]